eukprot:s6774_g2.t1
MSALSYHTNGCTPLIAALQTAQYEGAAALIAAGARLDLTNSRGLEGLSSECQRVATLALLDGYVEVAF